MRSNIKVREINEDEYDLWNKLVEESPQGTVFHNSDWLTTCSNLLNKKIKIYGCFKGDQLVSGCSLYIYKSKRVFKKAYSTCEMTPYGGVLLSQSQSSKVREQERMLNKTIKALLKIFDVEGFDYINLSNSPDFVDIRPFTWNGWSSKVYYVYYFNLEGDIEKTISKNARRTIREAIKTSITVEKLNNNDLISYFPQYYDLFKMTYHRQNIQITVSKKFLKNMINMLHDHKKSEIWIAKTSSGEIAAAEVIMFDNKRAYRWSPVTHTKLRKTGAASLLLYKIFHNLEKKGFKEFDLAAANTPQLAKFIASFNPRLVPCYEVEKSGAMFKIVKNVYMAARSIYTNKKKCSRDSI